jgi:ribose-phosphate pyrophosphokinase
MRVVLPMPGNEEMAAALAMRQSAELGALEIRRFPDQECYARIASDVGGRDVDLVCTLARPDPQILGLIFAANTARELGAASVNLIAPYLAYMRQDQRFRKGEAISSIHFANLLSGAFDSLVTIDPHLHRRRDLGEIFAIPTRVEHAEPLIADWIGDHVVRPLVIGPDSESEQWVSAVAERAGAPHVVLGKRRLGDRQVEIIAPDLHQWTMHVPVLVDDVASSGGTMIEAARQLREQGLSKPFCVVVHALFAQDSFQALCDVSEQVVSTDTVPHASNAISVAALLAEKQAAS